MNRAKVRFFLYPKGCDMVLDGAVESAIVAKVAELGFETYEIKYFSAGGKKILRIFADGKDGISLDQCAAISRGVSEYLDETEFGGNAYTLEVSSPGLDRPLVTPKDFRRLVDKKVQVRYRNEAGKQRKIAGLLMVVSDTTLTIAGEKGSEEISFESVDSGKFIV